MKGMEEKKKAIDQVLTIREACERWGLAEPTIRLAITHRGRFEKHLRAGLVRKSGATWLIHIDAMREVFGDETESRKREKRLKTSD